jgi:hypothetical protein
MTPERPRPILSETTGTTDKQEQAPQQQTAPKPRSSFGQHLKDLFGKLAETVTGKPTPTLAARRKRRDEGERGFRMYAAPIAEHLPAPIQRATDFLWNVLDWLNPTSNWNQPHPHEQLDQCASAAQHYPTFDL